MIPRITDPGNDLIYGPLQVIVQEAVLPFAAVEVTETQLPFDGVVVQVEQQIVLFSGGGGGGGGGGNIAATTQLLAGDGVGNAIASGVPISQVTLKQPVYPTPTTLNQVIACLQAAGLCA